MRETVLFRFIITNLLCCLLMACAHGLPPEKTITEENYQILCNPLVLKKHQQIIVRLSTSTISGYKWSLESDASPILALQKNKIKKDDTPKNPLHRHETIWKFTAVSSGESTLSFIYRLDWDNDINNAQRIQCNIVVDN